jgi:cysteine synthase
MPLTIKRITLHERALQEPGGRACGGKNLWVNPCKVHAKWRATIEWQRKGKWPFPISTHWLGQLTESKILLEASGNTGAPCYYWKRLVLVTLCLPENASRERKEILQSLGAEIIFTSRLEGTDGAQQIAKELANLHPDLYFYASQYTNANNWKAHYFGTAEEIISEVGGITHFVAGLGTTGTFVGTGRRLREFNPSIKLISLQPDSALHGMEGWKHLDTAIVPTNIMPLWRTKIWRLAPKKRMK